MNLSQTLTMASSNGDVRFFHQHVVVMRHGDRLDNSEPLWAATAPRPWDPPLDDAGRARAFRAGEKFREQLGFPIHRVFVSPFLRCLQTAAEVVTALSAVAEDSGEPMEASNGVVSDPSKVKISIEYGLSEMMNSRAIRDNVSPKDQIFSFNMLQCEAVLPSVSVDKTVEMVYKEGLPKWNETIKDARDRYLEVIKVLADKHPSENLLFVTHGEGVEAHVRRCMKVDGGAPCGVNYCGYSVSHRSISKEFVGLPAPYGLVGIALPKT